MRVLILLLAVTAVAFGAPSYRDPQIARTTRWHKITRVVRPNTSYTSINGPITWLHVLKGSKDSGSLEPQGNGNDIVHTRYRHTIKEKHLHPGVNKNQHTKTIRIIKQRHNNGATHYYVKHKITVLPWHSELESKLKTNENANMLPLKNIDEAVVKLWKNTDYDVLKTWHQVAQNFGFEHGFSFGNVNELRKLYDIIEIFVWLTERTDFEQWSTEKVITKIRDELRLKKYSSSEIKNDLRISSLEERDKTSEMEDPHVSFSGQSEESSEAKKTDGGIYIPDSKESSSSYSSYSEEEQKKIPNEENKGEASSDSSSASSSETNDKNEQEPRETGYSSSMETNRKTELNQSNSPSGQSQEMNESELEVSNSSYLTTRESDDEPFTTPVDSETTSSSSSSEEDGEKSKSDQKESQESSKISLEQYSKESSEAPASYETIENSEPSIFDSSPESIVSSKPGKEPNKSSLLFTSSSAEQSQENGDTESNELHSSSAEGIIQASEISSQYDEPHESSLTASSSSSEQARENDQTESSESGSSLSALSTEDMITSKPEQQQETNEPSVSSSSEQIHENDNTESTKSVQGGITSSEKIPEHKKEPNEPISSLSSEETHENGDTELTESDSSPSTFVTEAIITNKDKKEPHEPWFTSSSTSSEQIDENSNTESINAESSSSTNLAELASEQNNKPNEPTSKFSSSSSWENHTNGGTESDESKSTESKTKEAEESEQVNQKDEQHIDSGLSSTENAQSSLETNDSSSSSSASDLPSSEENAPSNEPTSISSSAQDDTSSPMRTKFDELPNRTKSAESWDYNSGNNDISFEPNGFRNSYTDFSESHEDGVSKSSENEHSQPPYEEYSDESTSSLSSSEQIHDSQTLSEESNESDSAEFWETPLDMSHVYKANEQQQKVIHVILNTVKNLQELPGLPNHDIKTIIGHLMVTVVPELLDGRLNHCKRNAYVNLMSRLREAILSFKTKADCKGQVSPVETTFRRRSGNVFKH